MAIIGTICPRLSGHLNPQTTLCHELQRRGHRVIFYQAPMAAEKIRSRGFEVRCFGEKEFSLEEHLKNLQAQATLSGYKAFRHTHRDLVAVVFGGLSPKSENTVTAFGPKYARMNARSILRTWLVR